MSLLADAIGSALEELEGLLDTPKLYINGEGYPCVPNALGKRLETIDGGSEAIIVFDVFVRRDAFIKPITVDSDQIRVDSDRITVDAGGKGPVFGEELTVDATDVTVDSDKVKVDSARKVPVSGIIVQYQNRNYRILNREDTESHFKFTLIDPNAR